MLSCELGAGLYTCLQVCSLACAACHLLWEKESRFIKFHAMQAFVLNAIGAALGFLVSVVIGGIFTISVYNPYTAHAALGIADVVGLLTTVISIIVLVFAVTAMIKAYKYAEYRIPLVGGIAAKLVEKVK